MSQSDPLRALIQRLTSTPVEDLPSIAYFLASSISRCLAAPKAPGIDRAALLHKLKTRISSLLQDRAPEGRFAAVVVAKAVLEAGGREILVDSEPWIRGLIGILNKSDPVATKKLAILTISRAFILTQDYPSIVRELTTPLLPSFNTACLAAVRPKTTKIDKGTQNILNPLLPTALQCWKELLPRHPATFRPFVTRFRPICLSLLSDTATPANISEYAGALLVALHHSAPKNTAISEWSQLCQDAIRAAHTTATQLFRSVREEWTPAGSEKIQASESSLLKRELPSEGPDVLGLAEWTSVHSGTQRLVRLLSLIRASISATTAAEVPVPLGGMMNLCVRVLSLTIPGAGKDSPYTLKSNPEFSKDEREALWSEVPTAHVSCLDLLSQVVDVLQHAILPISKSILDQLTWLFGAEKDLQDVRVSSYGLLNQLLPITGATAAHTDVKNVSEIIRYACRDLLQVVETIENTADNEKSTKTTAINADSFSGPPKTYLDLRVSDSRSSPRFEAETLISTFLQHIPAHLIPNNLRTEVDRTAILTQQTKALLASVLNPAPAQHGKHAPASLLPFLAQTNASLDLEALLRPRMPVIVEKQSNGIGMDTTEPEIEDDGANLYRSIEKSVLHRLDHPLEETTVDEFAERPPANGLETSEAASESLTAFSDMTSVAIKRDFVAMNGNGVDVWHTTSSPMLSTADTGIKKARMDENSVRDTETSRPVFENPEQSKSSAQTNPVVEMEEQSTVKSLSKGTGHAVDADDSDSEIPEINVEPDTDEDEDEDEDMYG